VLFVSLYNSVVYKKKTIDGVYNILNFFRLVLTDYGQIIPEAARLAFPEIHSTSVCRRIMPFYIIDYQNRRARKGCSEKGAWTENAGIRRVMRLRHWVFLRVDSVTRKKFILETFKTYT